jgi:hypothetical protein
MELALVELDTGVELDVTECAEVVGAELVGGGDLGSGRGRQMGHAHDGRHESGWRAGNAGRAALASDGSGIHPVSGGSVGERSPFRE